MQPVALYNFHLFLERAEYLSDVDQRDNAVVVAKDDRYSNEIIPIFLWQLYLNLWQKRCFPWAVLVHHHILKA